jgi:hypothetical protein
MASDDSTGAFVMDIDTSTSPSELGLPQTRSAPARNGVAKNTATSPRVSDADHKKFVDEFGFELTDEDDVAAEVNYVMGIDGQRLLRR